MQICQKYLWIRFELIMIVNVVTPQSPISIKLDSHQQLTTKTNILQTLIIITKKDIIFEKSGCKRVSDLKMSIGIPVKILHEADSHVITLELRNGDLYRGTLIESEDNMNCRMENITMTAKNGKQTQIEQIYIRGSKIRFFILPDMLKNAPMFKRIDGRTVLRGKSLGIGRSVGRARGGPPRGKNHHHHQHYQHYQQQQQQSTVSSRTNYVNYNNSNPFYKTGGGRGRGGFNSDRGGFNSDRGGFQVLQHQATVTIASITRLHQQVTLAFIELFLIFQCFSSDDLIIVLNSFTVNVDILVMIVMILTTIVITTSDIRQQPCNTTNPKIPFDDTDDSCRNSSSSSRMCRVADK
ncbi:LSM domain-containing protein [Heterostelium album PN500]|uniref:LSM domain-containing protein n=1 Tax=Heterostelium pallidum (strain ATCC 26659 / Pp 5 / PN500) TaxID=670386 RepID=D3BRM5_HETP5|nr:LSM domain-containing protein [Heterostelium album PN500]EFA76057.1 LSM domain-containing protein [Heterostelium album PN500]|eukprot:XP_020428191.1 LSM domain-containing protein [Heterostelium album PN500]